MIQEGNIVIKSTFGVYVTSGRQNSIRIVYLRIVFSWSDLVDVSNTKKGDDYGINWKQSREFNNGEPIHLFWRVLLKMILVVHYILKMDMQQHCH